MAQPAYNVKDLQSNTPGKTRENSGDESAEAGLWRHPESRQEAVTLWDPLFGDVQSQAFKRLGFERVGDAPEGYVKTVADTAAAANAAGPVSDDEIRGLRARLTQLENDKSTNQTKDALDEAGRYNPKEPRDAAEQSGEDAKANAVESHNARDQGEVELTPAGDMKPAGENPQAPALSDKALSKQNKTELLATAAAEGLEVDSELSNKKIVEAIEANRVKPASTGNEESEN